MFAKLFLLFAIMPIVEIALLVNMSGVIGGWNTIALVIATAFLGAHLVRQQGIATFAKVQDKFRSGGLPGQELAEAMLLLVAGVLLVTPGFVTDVIGLLFCLPFTRPLIVKALIREFGHKVVVRQSQGFHQHHSYSSQQQYRHTYNADDSVIEGEYEKKEERQKLQD